MNSHSYNSDLSSMKKTVLTAELIESKRKAELRRSSAIRLASLLPILGLFGAILSPILTLAEHSEQDKPIIKRYTCKSLTSSLEDYAPSRFLASFYYGSNRARIAYSFYFTNPWDPLNMTLVYQKTKESSAYYFSDTHEYDIDNFDKLERHGFQLESLIFEKDESEAGAVKSFNLTLEQRKFTEFSCAATRRYTEHPYWNRRAFSRLNWVYAAYQLLLLITFCVNRFSCRSFPVLSVIGSNSVQTVYLALGKQFGEVQGSEYFILGYFFLGVVYGLAADIRHKEINTNLLKIIFIAILPACVWLYSRFALEFQLHFATIYITVIILSTYMAIDCFFFLKSFAVYGWHSLFVLFQAFVCLNVYDGFGQTLISFFIFCVVMGVIFVGNLIIVLIHSCEKSKRRKKGKKMFDPTEHLDMKDYLSNENESRSSREKNRVKSEKSVVEMLNRSSIN